MGLLSWLPWNLETILRRIERQGEMTMATLKEFITAQEEHNARIGTSISGLTGDVASLNAKIQELTDSLGQVSPEDQVKLDELKAQGESLASGLEALDNMTPPAPPNP